MAPVTTSFFFNSFDNTTFRDFDLRGGAAHDNDGRLSLTTPNVRNSFGQVLYVPSIKFYGSDCKLNFDTIITFQIDRISGSQGSIAFSIFDLPATGHPESRFAVKFAADQDGDIIINFDVEPGDSRNSADLKDCLGKKVTAIISYRDGKVRVVAFTDTDKAWARYDIDLKSVLSQPVKVGISASSINCVENHYVYWWSFNSVLPRDEESGGSSK